MNINREGSACSLELQQTSPNAKHKRTSGDSSGS